MYIPKINQETELNTLQDFMQAHNFTIMVTHHDGQLTATHLPLILDIERGTYGTLIGHMARANKQWQSFDKNEVIIIFNGPHAYISPTWYEHHPRVPTWNYSTVHAYGVPHIIEEPSAVEDSLRALVESQEKERDPSWKMDVPQEFIDVRLQAIVAFEIEITRLEGKFKLSQNKTEAEKKNVISELLNSDYEGDIATGKLMQQRQQ